MGIWDLWGLWPGFSWRKFQCESAEKCEQYYREQIRGINGSPDGFNFVVVGPTGAGKSSFINSIFTTIDGEYADVVSTRAALSNDIGTTGFDVISSGSQKCLIGNVTIIDTKGINTDSLGIKEDQLKAVMDGKLAITSASVQDRETTEERISYRPHSVIIVVSADSMHCMGKDHAMAKELKKIYNAIPKDVSPIAVITHCDKLDDVKGDLNKVYKSLKMKKAVDMVQELIGITQENIMPVVNYVGEFSRHINTLQNVYMLEAIYRAMRNGHNRRDRVKHRK